jgi:hypothetical protein
MPFDDGSLPGINPAEWRTKTARQLALNTFPAAILPFPKPLTQYARLICRSAGAINLKPRTIQEESAMETNHELFVHGLNDIL